ncbi:hypothetical protein [Clostridium sp. BJN0013]|uniref:hypothetical protein n=1 Tax=Clostridium sp. BJN0013 TaxID=3236840 RepID=UPI0034C65386
MKHLKQNRHKRTMKISKIDELYKQIGRLTTENQWMKKNLVSSFSRNERIFMIDFNWRELPLSV